MSDLREAADPYIRPGTVVPIDVETTSILVGLLRQALEQPTYEFECPRCGHCCQQVEWFGLTDEEAREIRLKVGSASDVYARAIEAALKEKNT